MNEDNLGGYSPTQNNVLGTYAIGRCWCGESYFVDPTDGLGRVVSSGNRDAIVWKVQTSPSPCFDTGNSVSGDRRHAGSGILHHDLFERHCQSNHLGSIATV